MKWLAGWDFSARVMPALPVWLSQIIFAILCALGFVMLRAAVDVFAPSAGPFALIYPFVLAATLFGRWQAGVIANILTILYIWFYILPVPGHLGLERSGDEPRMLVNIIAGAIIICLAEIFRRAVADATAARESQIAERDLLLREIDHRVKNNFATVAGLIQLQRQRATHQTVRDELGVALNRIESFATAHMFLYRDGARGDVVNMQMYLEQLSAALSSGLLRSDDVRIVCISEPIDMPRDRAVSIGLIVNELVTNAAKHAFPDDRIGCVVILFRRADDAIELVVEDDGCGIADAPRQGSLGRRLIAGFVQQAAGELTTQSSPEGTICRVLLR
jgi:two-component sensor histidine kinase